MPELVPGDTTANCVPVSGASPFQPDVCPSYESVAPAPASGDLLVQSTVANVTIVLLALFHSTTAHRPLQSRGNSKAEKEWRAHIMRQKRQTLIVHRAA